MDKVFYAIKKNSTFVFDRNFLCEKMGMTLTDQSPFLPFVDHILQCANAIFTDENLLSLSSISTIRDSDLRRDFLLALEKNYVIYNGILFQKDDTDNNEKFFFNIFFHFLQSYEDENINLIVIEL